MKIKELFCNYCIIILRGAKQRRSSGRRVEFCFCFLFEPKFLVSSALFCSSSIPLPSSLNHSISSRSHFRSFPPTVTLKVFLPCLFRHRAELSVSFPSPLSLSFCCLPLFSLASSVRLPRDSRLLCSRYRPIDFGKGRENTVDMIHHA